MRYALCLGLVLLSLAGCQLPAEQLQSKPTPLNDVNQGFGDQTFADLVGTARAQVTSANEAADLDHWSDVEEAAKALAKTSGLLGKATQAPPRHRDRLEVEAGDLGKEANVLRDAAAAKDPQKVTDSLQRLNLKVRELRKPE